MIKYALRCVSGHDFDSWFRDSTAFDALLTARQVTCSVCGDARVEKTLMAPAVSGAKKKKDREAEAPLSAPETPAEAALKMLRQHLKKNSDYVGKEFAEEARRIHVGESEQRSIWGEATAEDAKALKDEGIPVAPIPFMPRRDD